MSSYEQKYLKYKQKYLALKEQYPFVQGDSFKQKYVVLKEQYPFVQGDSFKQKYVALKEQMIGGGKYFHQIKILKALLDKNQKIPDDLLKIFNYSDFNLTEYKSELDIIRDKIFGKIVQKGLVQIDFEEYIKNYITKEEIRDYFGISEYRECNIEELMTLPDYDTKCKNVTKVSGSCDDPSFLHNNNEISDIQKIKYENIIDIITAKFKNESEPKYLDFVLGAVETKEDNTFNSNFNDRQNSFTLNINISLIPRFLNYDTFINELNKLSSLKNQKLYLNEPFPLSHNFPNSKHILDRIIYLHNSGLKVRITNRMCGTCHRSLYYLVKHGIEYIVAPEQGVKITDTEEIQKCFKKKPLNFNF
jgi:hypothetical protein